LFLYLFYFVFSQSKNKNIVFLLYHQEPFFPFFV